MGWREELRTGSFRGVRFKIEASSAEFGRRNVDHEYPQRDVPYSEDLGRRQREFTVEAYVIGDDYISQRDALIAACEQPDRGELVHPYYGTSFVVVKACRVNETVSEGRMARISITFAEAGERVFPASSKNILSRLGIAGDSLETASIDSFGSTFRVASMPQFVSDGSQALIGNLVDQLNSIKVGASGSAAFAQSVQDFSNDLSSIIVSPATLAQSIVDIIREIDKLSFDAGGIADAYKSLFGFGDDDPTVFAPLSGILTPSREQEGINRAEVINLIKRTAIVGAGIAAADKASNSSRLLTRQPQPDPVDALYLSPRLRGEDSIEAGVIIPQFERVFPTFESMIEERDLIFEAIDSQMEVVEDDQVFQELQEFRSELAQAIPSPDTTLPNIRSYFNPHTQPSLVITYDLYDALGPETDLINRNRVQHPGFVPGGESIEVVRNG